MTIELGAIVMTPVTDDNGEQSFVYGQLIGINSRFAKVKTDDGEIRVGKSKIELVSNPGTELFCPECNSSNIYSYEDAVMERNTEGVEWTHEHSCVECGHDFGKELSKVQSSSKMSRKLKKASEQYSNCVASSGKSSKDNGDAVAIELRGQTLDFAYQRASEYLEIPEVDLRSKYAHLNVGQQRMCLGNRIRSKK